MDRDSLDCYEVETSEIVYHDATSVKCNADREWWGTPVYDPLGEYESGCQECDEDLGCPTAAPTTSPTPFPTDAPTNNPTAAPTASPTQANCNDGILNGDESAVDCGGGKCEKCAAGKLCEDGPQDCESGVCTLGTCAAPTAAPTAPPTTAPPTTEPPTTEPPTPATGAAVGGLRGGDTDAPTTEDEGDDDGMSTHTRLGVIVGGVAVILALTFFAKMSKSRVDKRAQKDREFRRRHSSARLSGGVGELTTNPMRSPGRSESSSANVEQAPSEPPAPGGDGGGGGGEGDESPTLTNDTLELAAN